MNPHVFESGNKTMSMENLACYSTVFFLFVALFTLLHTPAHSIDPRTFDELIQPDPGDSKRLQKSKRILRRNSDHTMALYGFAHSSYELGRYKDAVKMYQHMIDIGVNWNPHFIYSDRAVVLARLGRYQEAEQSFRKSMEMNPTFAHPHSGLAIMWIRQGRNYKKAEKFLKEAIQYESFAQVLKDCYRAYLGAAILKQGRTDRAIEILKQAKKKIPVQLVRQNYPVNDIEAVYEVRYFLARAYEKKGQDKKARQELNEVIEVYHKRKNAPDEGRSSQMPSGTWKAYEHPNVFRFLFHRWELP
ncbi:MAG: tetratricopeptide repeat protein [bacterium]